MARHPIAVLGHLFECLLLNRLLLNRLLLNRLLLKCLPAYGSIEPASTEFP